MLCVDPQAEVVPNWALRSPCVVVQNLSETAASYWVRGSLPLSTENEGLAEPESPRNQKKRAFAEPLRKLFTSPYHLF